MKKLLLGALIASVATAAFAADLPTQKAPPPPAPVFTPPPSFSWTGFYIGANGGYAFANTSSNSFGSPSGGFVGGTLGYNYQMNQFVLGVEGDWDWAGLGHTQNTALGSYRFHENSILTARARAGVAVNRALFFVTGGYGGMEADGRFDPTGQWDKKWRNGGALGAGVEYAITNNVTAKAEYLYLPMTTRTYFAGTPARVSSPLSELLLRVGMNYKF